MKARSILLTVAALLLCVSQIMAQSVPEGINYQAVARDGFSLLDNQNLDVRFTLFEGGTQQYVEVQSVTTNPFGVFSAVVGTGQVVSGDFSTLNWGSGDWFLKVEIDANSGQGYVDLGTNKLQSVPFSLYAKEAATVTNFGVDDLDDVIAPAPDSGDVLKFDGTQWVTSPDAGNSVIAGAGLAFSNDTLINTGDTDPNDDLIVGSLADGDLSGTLPNPLVDGLQGNPVSATAPNLDYVLKWNGSEWAPAPDNVTSGGGVNVTARLTGDGSAGGGELDIAQQGASFGQVLKWNGASWSPGDDDSGFQTLTLTGNILTLGPNGNSVNLPVSTYVAGTGILIQGGNTIVNTGDTDPFDDVRIGDPAGGDLFGPMPAPIVTGIRGVSVSATASSAQAGQILKFNNGQWEPATDEVNDPDADPTNEIQVLTQPNATTIELSKGGGTVNIPTYTAGPGINITGFTINNTGDLNGSDDVLIGSTVPGGDLTGTYPSPTIGKLQGITLASVAPAPGQVLKFQNGEWQPGANEDADADPTNEIQDLILNGFTLGLTGSSNTVTLPSPPTYLAGTGINITGVTITNTGDTNPNDDLLLTTQFSGDVTGVYNGLTVERIQGNPVSTTQPQFGQILKWNGIQWAPEDDEVDDQDTNPLNEIQTLSQSGATLSLSNGGGSTTLFTAGTGISVAGNVINNTGDVNPADDLLLNSPAGGDLGGTYPNPSVEQIKGVPVAGISPSFGQVLKFIGGQWVPTQDDFIDSDADPSNEFQTITQSGNELTLSDGGGTVTMYQAGNGISVSGNTISNTGDLDGNDDVLKGSAAGGDLGGTYPDPTVEQIKGVPVAGISPSFGQVLKFIGGQWVPAQDDFIDSDADPSNEFQTISQSGNQLTLSDGGGTITMYQAGAGIDVAGNVIINTGDLDPNDDVTLNSPASGDLSGTYPSPTVARIQGQAVSSSIPNANQILKYIGGQWIPATDQVDDADSDPTNEFQTVVQQGNQFTLSDGGGTITMYQAGSGISVTGNVINNIGGVNPADDVLISDIAGGDATGTFSNLTVTGLQGSEISTTPPSFNGQVLKWNSTTLEWEPGTDLFEDADNDPVNEFQTISQTGVDLTLSDGGGTVTLVQPGAGIGITGNTITNTGDLDPLNDVLVTDNAGGDVTGTFNNLSVVKLQGNDVSPVTPVNNGEVLKWNAVTQEWVPGPDGNTTYTGGTGITITGTVISNDGDLNPNDDVLISDNAGGDVSGVFSNLTVGGIQGSPVTNTPPTTTGQILEWDATAGQWVLGTDDVIDGDANSTNELQTITQNNNQLTLSDGGGTVTLYQAGTGISVTGNVISNTGDLDGNDDININDAASGDLTGTYPSPTVAALQGHPIASNVPINGQVLKYAGGQWVPSTDAVDDADADATNELQTVSQSGVDLTLSNGGGTVTLVQPGTGINISGNTIINTGDTNAGDDVTLTTASSGDVSGDFTNGLTVIGLQGTPVSTTAPVADGQVLKWNNVTGEWEPGTDGGFTYTAGTGIDVTGTVISNTGDLSTTNELQTISQTGVDLTLSDGGGTVTLVQAGTGIQILGNSIVNTGDTDTSNDVEVGDAAGGDLGGTFPSPTVAGIQGQPVANVAPSSGQILKFVGGQWVPSADEVNDADADATNELQSISQTGVDLTLSDGGGTVTLVQAGTGVSISGNTIANTGDTDGTDDVLLTTGATGDVSGDFTNGLTVTGLQGTGVSTTAPTTNGQVLKWNSVSGEWEPGTDGVNTYTAGSGIDVTGTVISNTGDTDGTDDVLLTTAATGDVSGDFTNGLTVTALQGTDVSTTAPTTDGQVLKWNAVSGEWEPGTDGINTYTAGAGIDVTGTVISNTGDTDGTDDVLLTTAASGDVSGDFSNGLTVTALQGTGVSSTAPTTNGQVLKWNNVSGEWEPGTDDGTTYTAGTGIDVTGTVISNTGDADGTDDVLLTTAASGDVSGDFTNGLTVAALQGTGVSTTAPTTDGQVLKWNSTSGEWEPGSDDGTTYTGGTGIDVTGTTITNTGDLSATNELQTISQSGVDLTLSDGGGTVTLVQPGAGILISGNTIINSGDVDASDDVEVGDAAGGDLSGTYPSPTVAAIQGQSIANVTPTAGQVLKYTAGQWLPSTDAVDDADADVTNELQTISQTGVDLTLSDGGGTVTLVQAGTGVSITGNTIANTGDTDASDDVTLTTAASGDVSGDFTNGLTVTGLQGTVVSTTAPTTNGQVLKWNSTSGEWEPGTDDGSNYTGGAGIDVTGTTITNTGDTDATDDVLLTTAATGDVSGDFTNGLTVEALQGVAVSANVPTTNGQVLKWNNTTSEWEPGTDNTTDADADATNELQTVSQTGNQLTLSDGGGTVTLFTAGTGIDVTSNVISNTGDTDGTDDIKIGDNASGDLDGTFPSPTVTGIQGVPVANLIPANKQVLKYNNGQWFAAADSVEDADADASNELQTVSLTGVDLTLSNGGGTVTLVQAGTGISVTGNTIENTGDTDGTDDLLITDTAGGDVDGQFSNLTVQGLQGQPVSATAPTFTGQVLKWNNTTGEWEPGTDAGIAYTAGPGISIVGTVISNSGDLNPADDLTTGTIFGGDVSGVYTNLSVDAIQGNSVSASAPTADGQVLKWNSTLGQWEPGSNEDGDADDTNELQTLSQTGVDLTLSDGGGTVTLVQAGTGITLTGNTIINSGDTDGTDDVLLTTAAGGDISGNFSALTVEKIQGNAVAASVPTTDGQVLKWDNTNSQWDLGTDENTTYTAGTGITINGSNQISNAGDINATDDVLLTTAASGDVSGDFTNGLDVIAIQGSGISTTTPTTTGQVLVWNNATSEWEPGTDQNTTYTAGAGITINGSNQVINTGDTDGTDDVLLTTAASGDVSGDFTNGLDVIAIQGSGISTTAPTTTGQVLVWNNATSEWEPGTDQNTTYTAGAGITINGSNEVINTGDTDGTDDVLLTTAASGDVSGDFTNGLDVIAIQGSDISTTAPTTTGQVLVWNNTTSEWEPGTDQNTTYTAGAGITINGSNEVINTGDTDGTDDVLLTTAATGDVNGDFTNGLDVVAIQGSDVSTTAPTTTGQVLVWNNVAAEWEPGTDQNTTYTAGAGITIDGSNQIINDGDTDGTDDVLLTTAATGDVNGDFTNGLDVVAIQGSDVSTTAPTTTGQVLVWNNVASEWEPGTDQNTTYTAGAGITINGSNEVINTGDTDGTDDVLLTTAATGDVTGDFTTGLDVVAIQGTSVSGTAPVTNEFFRYDGTDWVADSINVAEVKVDGSWIPTTTDVYDLGSSTFKWNDIWALNPTIQTSDLRAKEDIVALDYGMDEIMALRPVSYNWIQHPEQGRKLGLIAQEVEEVVAEAVRTHSIKVDPSTGEVVKTELDLYGMSYTDLIPVMINAMQEQQHELESQRDLLEQQASLIEALEDRIEALENR